MIIPFGVIWVYARSCKEEFGGNVERYLRRSEGQRGRLGTDFMYNSMTAS